MWAHVLDSSAITIHGRYFWGGEKGGFKNVLL